MLGRASPDLWPHPWSSAFQVIEGTLCRGQAVDLAPFRLPLSFFLKKLACGGFFHLSQYLVWPSKFVIFMLM